MRYNTNGPLVTFEGAAAEQICWLMIRVRPPAKEPNLAAKEAYLDGNKRYIAAKASYPHVKTIPRVSSSTPSSLHSYTY